MMTSRSYRWVRSINEIGKAAWDRVFKNQSILKSYGFSIAVEKAGLEGVEFHYLVGEQNGTIDFILPCFQYEARLEILGGNQLKAFTKAIRSFYPPFLNPKMMIVGSPVATCQNFLDRYGWTDREKECIFNCISEKSLDLGTSLTIVKEIPDHELEAFQTSFPKFKVFDSLANSFIPISKKDFPYPALLRKKYRQRYRHALKQSNLENYTWQIERDFSVISKAAHKLYLNVYEKSKHKFEKLTLAFYDNLGHYLPENCFFLTCHNPSGELVCAELVVEGEDELIPMYLGLDYSQTQNTAVYNNVIFRTVLEAERRDKNWVVLGQTSYDIKAYAGAHFERLHLGIYTTNPLLRFAMAHAFRYLFPPFLKPTVNSISAETEASAPYQQILSSSKLKFQ